MVADLCSILLWSMLPSDVSAVHFYPRVFLWPFSSPHISSIESPSLVGYCLDALFFCPFCSPEGNDEKPCELYGGETEAKDRDLRASVWLYLSQEPAGDGESGRVCTHPAILLARETPDDQRGG